MTGSESLRMNAALRRGGGGGRGRTRGHERHPGVASSAHFTDILQTSKGISGNCFLSYTAVVPGGNDWGKNFPYLLYHFLRHSEVWAAKVLKR